MRRITIKPPKHNNEKYQKFFPKITFKVLTQYVSYLLEPRALQVYSQVSDAAESENSFELEDNEIKFQELDNGLLTTPILPH
jgi:hypothetical protein